MRVLVTGATGFIGQYVVRALRGAGHHVSTLDVVGDVDYQMDVTTPLPNLDPLLAVVHLAALSHPRQCDADPAKAFTVNVAGTSNVLKMALASGAKKFVFASSGHVYQIPPLYSPSDEFHPLRLGNTYTTTKILGEQLCQLYFENHGLPYTTLRLYNAYGPGQMPGYFIPDMIQRAKSGKIDLPGGNTTKDWVFVEDVARAFVTAIETDFVGPINIGTGVETPLSDIASKIAGVADAAFTSSNSPTASRMCADISRANVMLGWQPKVTIWEGLDAVLNLVKT